MAHVFLDHWQSYTPNPPCQFSLLEVMITIVSERALQD